MRTKKKVTAPVTPTQVSEDEVADAILHMIVEKFGDRVLELETIERGFTYALFKIKEAALFAKPL